MAEEENENIQNEAQAGTASSDEEGTIEESKLPFPRATVTNMMRQYLDDGKQI